ncbi:hypothetical protein N7486_003467 [Penicillium sp. IBT 16267x]|nr:hypothetical protein N7486_003467 [Penicillium sp. IBT 16267x]
MAILEFLWRRGGPPDTGEGRSHDSQYTTTTVNPTGSVQSDATSTTTKSELGATVLGGASTTATASTASITTPTATLTSTSTSTSTSTTSTAAASHSGGESTTTKLAIALPIAIVGALAIIAIVFFLIRRRRRKQRGAVPSTPTYDTNEGKVISTTQIRSAQPHEPATAGLPRYPMMDVSGSRESEMSAGQIPTYEYRTERGHGMAVSRDQRPNATEQASPANVEGSQIRLPFENRGATDDDAVSVVSDEHRAHGHDYDDMSSVSSFDGDSPRANDRQHPFR